MEDSQVKVNLFILGVKLEGLLIALQGLTVFLLPAQSHPQTVIKVDIVWSVVNGLEEELLSDLVKASG